jgi:multicomponent Na+:H+ antiporter subunit G
MAQAMSTVLMLLGAFFMVVAGIGIVRMPDLYLRMSCTSKAATLGAGCLLAAVIVEAADAGIALRALAAIVFLLLTAPVAAHMIGRAAYLIGVPLWEGTRVDELRGRYTPDGRVLSSPPSHRAQNQA